jgi:hypothetical protein
MCVERVALRQYTGSQVRTYAEHQQVLLLSTFRAERRALWGEVNTVSSPADEEWLSRTRIDIFTEVIHAKIPC